MDESASQKFIRYHRLEPGKTWGFAVVRPTGAAANEDDWNLAIERLRNVAVGPLIDYDEEISLETLDRTLDTASMELLANSLHLPVLDLELGPDDAVTVQTDLPGSDPLIQKARACFLQFRQEREEQEEEGNVQIGATNLDACILLDRHAVRRLTDSTVAPDDCHVMAVDVRGGRMREGYFGWMFVEPTSLTDLFNDLQLCMTMSETCARPLFKGQMPLYAGQPGKGLINPPGGVGPPTGGTQRGIRRGGEGNH